MGIDHFYLYDNTGTQKSPCYSGKPKLGICKYGFNYGSSTGGATSHLTDSDITHILNQIISRYADRITHVTWQPIHPTAKVIYYGQRRAIKDCIIKYGPNIDWLYCLDFDELFYSPDGLTVREAVEYCEANTFSKIRLKQYTFSSRYITDGNLTKLRSKYMSQIFNHIGLTGAKNRHPLGKSITRVNDINLSHKHLSPEQKGPSIHYIPIKSGCKTKTDINFARFNHYKLAEINRNFPGEENFSQDRGLEYFKHDIDKHEMVIDKYKK
jgi:hypothetical protein